MNIYVGNISYNTTESQLSELFSSKGTVDRVNIITDKYSGQSKGFGFVEMSNDDEGQKAIDELNGHSLDNRELNVSKARERQPRERRERY